MKVAHRNEYKDDVDVAIVLEDDTSFTHKAQKQISEYDEEKARLKIAVEFDGPHHFTVAASTRDDLELIEKGAKIVPRVLGHTVLKYRMLKKKGWTVVRIPYFEFDKIPHWATMERQRYLQRCLKTHKEIRFSGVDVSEYQAIPQTRHSRFD
jgi:very-short-patch-repair endonuclease